ncbi:MAG: M48 family metallopeptidase [Chloroflexota bacterium]
MNTTAYRYPNERLVLFVTLSLVLLVIALTATATVCASVIFVILFVLLSYGMSRSHHQELMRAAKPVTTQEMPGLARLIRLGVNRLAPGPIQVFVAPGRALNAYTFGLSSPKIVVLYAPLFQVMDEDEILFILGHELGHVALGHTWLNSLVGSMAGIPAPFGAAAILAMAFLWWNRMCEYSADRAGLLACGKPEKAITALVKLVAGPQADTPAELEAAYRKINAEDDNWLNSLGESFGTHPMLIRRIEALRAYTRTSQYRRLQEQMRQVE